MMYVWHSSIRYGKWGKRGEGGLKSPVLRKSQETAGWARMYACVVILMVVPGFVVSPMRGKQRERGLREIEDKKISHCGCACIEAFV